MTVEAMLHGTIHHCDFKLLQHYSNIAPLKIVFDTTMYFFLNFLNFFLTLKLMSKNLGLVVQSWVKVTQG